MLLDGDFRDGQDGVDHETPQRRAPRIILTSVFGDPLSPRTWSGAPSNLARALRRYGYLAEGADLSLSRIGKLHLAAWHLATDHERVRNGEALLRTEKARRNAARSLAALARSRGISIVLHTGTLDMSPDDRDDALKHYLYCDNTWNLSLRYRSDLADYSPRRIRRIEEVERECLRRMRHIFTFGGYVRSNLHETYGIPPDRVTVVGSGTGFSEPFVGHERYSPPLLLFVAKHYFAEKGGNLLLDAFRLARRRRPDMRLIMVGSTHPRRDALNREGVEMRPYVSQDALRDLYRRATLLVQPMLSDPWGQVYLEALAACTPVVGLNRNGLPEITDGGRYGFLIDRPDPELLARTILDAIADPRRLAQIGREGQRFVQARYSWDLVAQRISAVLRED
jgi:glycosyltransferase involved in cell wall biosynthesis